MKSEKTTQKETVSGRELRAFRENYLKFSLADTSRLLRIPVRTLEDYEADRRKVPAVVAVAIWLLQEKQERVTAGIIERLNRELDRHFPTGILSEAEPEEE
jgi:DNA-binding transcriptional regulator YiaG